MVTFKNDGKTVLTKDGVKIYYEVDGSLDREALFIIPGVGGSEEIYNNIADRLKDEFCVIKIDGRGIGLSDKPEGMYSIADMTWDVDAVLNDLGIKKAHLLGHSLGGFVAQEYYNRFPGRVKSLILVSTNAGYGDAHAVLASTQAINIINKKVEPDDPRLAEIILEKSLVIYHKNFVFSEEGKRKITEILLISKERVQYEHMVKRGYGGWQYSNFQNLKHIDVPVLVIQGADDQLAPAANAKIFGGEIPDCEVKIIQECGHLPFVEKEEEFIKLIRRFVEKNCAPTLTKPEKKAVLQV